MRRRKIPADVTMIDARPRRSGAVRLILFFALGAATTAWLLLQFEVVDGAGNAAKPTSVAAATTGTVEPPSSVGAAAESAMDELERTLALVRGMNGGPRSDGRSPWGGPDPARPFLPSPDRFRPRPPRPGERPR